MRSAPIPRPCTHVLELAKSSDFAQRVPPHILSSQPDVARDLVGGEVHRLRNGVALKPYEVPWLDCRMARVRRCNRARLPIDFCQLLRLLLRSIRAAEAKRSLRHEAR